MASKNQVTNPRYGKSKTGTFRPVGGRGVGLGSIPSAGRTSKGYKGWEWDALNTAATLVMSAFPVAGFARGATIVSKAAKAENIPASQVVKNMTRNTVKGVSSRSSVRGLQKSPSKGVGTPKVLSTKRKIAGGAVAGGAAAYGLSRIPTSSAAAPRQKYSGMKPGAERVRTGPGGAYVGSGMGAKARPKTGGGAYVGSTVGGNTGSRKTPAAPSGPSGGGGGGRPRQAGPSKKQVQARRAAITDLLSKAETAAAAGNIQAAANFSAAALNRQKAGKGSAASMKRVTKVARAYSTAAGRKKIENQEAGRTRLGKPPSNRRYA